MDTTRIHILVVDPDPLAARTICNSLKSAGYQVSTASNDSDAIILAGEKLFNLVIKSFDAQKIDAVAFMNKIRTATPDTQCIFVGGRERSAPPSMRSKKARATIVEADQYRATDRIGQEGTGIPGALCRGSAAQATPAPTLGTRHLCRQQRIDAADQPADPPNRHNRCDCLD